MRAIFPHRATFVLVLGLALGLAGCETSDVIDNMKESVQDFNPFGTAKTRLPGERKPVFPEGVPGVQQGVPPDLLVGAQPAQETPSPAAQSLAEPPSKPKASARRKARAGPPAQRAARSAEPALAPEEQPPSRARTTRPEPAAQPARARAPARPAQAVRPAPAPEQPQSPLPGSEPVPTVWPDPPKAGTFSR